jgi:hypothetical protein
VNASLVRRKGFHFDIVRVWREYPLTHWGNACCDKAEVKEQSRHSNGALRSPASVDRPDRLRTTDMRTSALNG